MTKEARFTDIPPLEYYYLHGYKLMNPFCRILSENPQYRFILEWRNLQFEGEKDSRLRLADSITIKTLMSLKGSLDSKALKILGLDEWELNCVITGDASGEHKALVKESGMKAEDLPSASQILGGARETARNRLGSLWQLLVQTRIALASAAPPSDTCLIRGDTSGMINYLSTQGVSFPPPTAAAFANVSSVVWRTNQFFSTSIGNELASLAGKALVWIIRINPGSTEGRSGGVYTSEAEILFPYDVSFKLDGVIGASSREQIAGLNLSGFSKAEELRAKMIAVYDANKNSWTDNKVRFLVATEQ